MGHVCLTFSICGLTFVVVISGAGVVGADGVLGTLSGDGVALFVLLLALWLLPCLGV